MIFSKRELTFTVAICYRPSVCLSSVTLVHPTQAVANFCNFSMAFGTLTSTENFMEIILGEPLRCVMVLILCYFTEFVYNVIFKQLLGLPRFQNLLLIVYGHINMICTFIQRLFGQNKRRQ